MIALGLFIKNIAGWIAAHKTVSILSAIVAILILTLLFNSYCGGKPKSVLNEKELQEVHEAIESKERGKMEKKFIEIEVEQKAIDANVSGSKAATVNAIADARKKVSEMSDSELAAYLESLK